MPRDRDDGIPLRRRPVPSRMSAKVILAVAAGAVAICVTVTILLVKRSQQQGAPALTPANATQSPAPAVPAVPFGGPSADNEGCDWTMKELVAYLNSKGLRVEMQVEPLFSRIVHISSPRYPVQKPKPDGLSFQVFRDDAVTSGTEPTMQRAKDYAGTLEHAFSWGRFVFLGGPVGLREDIRRVLPGSR